VVLSEDFRGSGAAVNFYGTTAKDKTSMATASELIAKSEAYNNSTREDRFMATVYAMNTLLVDKGIYTSDEFTTLFLEWIEKEDRQKSLGEKP
jgi:hypothetical protein